MSADLNQFREALNQDEELRASVTRALTAGNPTAVVDLAADRGYSFSTSDLDQFIGGLDHSALSDVELSIIAAGSKHDCEEFKA